MTSAFALDALVVIAIIMTLLMVSPALPSFTSASTGGLNQTQAEEVGAGTESITEAEKKKEEDAILLVSLLANELETRLNKSGAILEITSKLPELTSTPFADSISPELHGIPRDADMPKRKVAQDILAADNDFHVIFFLMPDGDMYLEEPYSLQENLTRNNFGFRDYYRGAIHTGSAYLSNVFISAATGRPEAYIATPMYSENSNDRTHLVGLWAGGLNFTNLSKSLQSLNLTNNGERIVYTGGHGHKAADSDKNHASQVESFADLQAFKNAVISGQAGSTTEMVNGSMMLVSYHPVKAFSNTWVVLFMQPYEDGNGGSSSSTNNSG